MMTLIVISIIFTLVILVLSLFTISKGYGYKHSIDPIPDSNRSEDDKQKRG